MSLIKYLKNLFRFGTSGLNGLELAVMEKCLALLGDHKRKTLMDHLSRINLVQRLEGGREVNCYVMDHGKPYRGNEFRLSENLGEQTLAQFLVSGNGLELSGKIWLVDGIFFSIEFDLPTEHVDRKDINRIDLFNVSV